MAKVQVNITTSISDIVDKIYWLSIELFLAHAKNIYRLEPEQIASIDIESEITVSYDAVLDRTAPTIEIHPLHLAFVIHDVVCKSLGIQPDEYGWAISEWHWIFC